MLLQESHHENVKKKSHHEHLDLLCQQKNMDA